MTTRQTLFVAIVVSLVLGIHLYLGWRLFGRSGLARWRAVGRGVLALSAALVLVAFPLARALPRSSALLHVQYAGFFAMGRTPHSVEPRRRPRRDESPWPASNWQLRHGSNTNSHAGRLRLIGKPST